MTFEYCIDSSVWLRYIEGRLPNEIVEIIDHGIVATSALAIAEVADKLTRDNAPFPPILAWIRSRCIILPLTNSGAHNAAIIKNMMRRTRPKFGLIDGIHLATARERHVPLITADTDFAGVEDVILV